MIHSLFVINHSGDVFMEKHWKSVIPRTVCDYFFEAQRQVHSTSESIYRIGTSILFLFLGGER